MKDRYGRKINYLRISVTDRCNFRCLYCMPEDGICKLPHEKIMRNEEIITMVKEMAELGINKVRITGGEPLTRKGIENLIREIKKIKGISEVSMTTNGYLLKEKLNELIDAGLDRLNISLDTLNEEKFKEITRGAEITPVLEAIDLAYQSKIKKVKINTVLMGGFNVEEIDDFVQFAEHRNIDIRFIELMPIGMAADWSKEKFISNDIVLEKVKGLEPVDYFDISSPARYYKKEGYEGLIGLINPISCQFCENCNRIRLTADGKIKPCLHSNEEIDILDNLRNHPERLVDTIKRGIFTKPKEHHLNDKDYIPVKRDMNKIGG